MKILLVEDDEEMSKVLGRTLERRGYVVTRCVDGIAALRHINEEANDLILLDLNLPSLDGLHILQRMRAREIATPVIILTARGAVGDRVAGLNSGADDYLAKPFDLEELDARIRAQLRRHGKDGMSTDPACGRLRSNRDSDVFYNASEPLELSARESTLLKLLIARPGHAVKKEKLLTSIYPGDKEVQPEAVEVLVHRLRKKLTDMGVEVVTLRGIGYLLRAARVDGESGP